MYDGRLKGGSAYLVADYTIQRDEKDHQWHVMYASVMAFLYCFGIPATSWCVLRYKRDAIQQLQMIADAISSGNVENMQVLQGSITSGSDVAAPEKAELGAGKSAKQQPARAQLKYLEKLEASIIEEDPL